VPVFVSVRQLLCLLAGQNTKNTGTTVHRCKSLSLLAQSCTAFFFVLSAAWPGPSAPTRAYSFKLSRSDRPPVSPAGQTSTIAVSGRH